MKIASNIKFQAPNLKSTLFLRRFFVGICLLSFGISATAARGEFTKTIKENFTVETNTRIEAVNKHGDMQIHTWDKNEVSFEITVTVEAKTEGDAQKEMDRIDVEFTNIPGVVRAETEWEEKERRRSWSIFDWSSWGDWSGWEDGNKIRIDYVIYMPSANVVDLNNKYGNIDFPTFDNDAKLTVKYGNMTGERVGGSFNLDIGYGDADISSVGGKAQVNVKYGKFRANVLQTINMESKYSKIYIENAYDIKIQSKYDHYELGTINNLRSGGKYDDFDIEKANNVEIDSKYSDYRIRELAGEGDFDMEYGNAKIKNMSTNFGNLEIDGSYTDFTFYMPSNAAYDVDAESSYGDLDFSDHRHLDIYKDGSDKEAEGYVGSPDSGNRLRARLRYGSLNVMMK